jgi:formylglycine-generating enzyme required for sulfatase activity
VIHAQGWFRDPGAPKQTNLSNGLRFTLCPGGAAAIPTPPGFVLIQPGAFQMGSNAGGGAPYFGGPNEQPVHSVTISSCFLMGETEVTQAQYSALMGTNPSYYPGSNSPVEGVTWSNAQAYCAALTAQQSALGNVPPGYQYRLPTEAEWEYSCRAGTTTEFNVGAELFCNQARFWASSHSSNSLCNSTTTVPVRSYAPNAWGLYDMHGNVLEWCLDSWANYSAGAVSDPYVTGGPSRVVRGGGYGNGSGDCRSGFRYNEAPSATSAGLGFRVVLAPILVP